MKLPKFTRQFKLIILFTFLAAIGLAAGYYVGSL